MTSRLTAFAATFAILATASLSYATGTNPVTENVTTATAATKSVRIVQLDRVVVTAKRLAPSAD